MSHHATNWAIQQRGLKPATKIVLWHLCDRHNPDNGCFPSQEKLAADCELSRSSLNDHLSILESRGLIRRVQRIDPVTKQQMSTSYVFAFEADFGEPQDVVKPCPEIGHGAVSGNDQKPCPENDETRVRKSDTNPVREPVIEPQGAQARGGGDQFDILWSGWPQRYRPDQRLAAEKAFRNLSSEEQLMAASAAPNFQLAMMRRKKPMRMIEFLKQQLFVEFFEAPDLDEAGRFRIVPNRPEWGPWLGHIRKTYGEDAVARTVKRGFFLPDTRWPARDSVAQVVTNMAPSGSD